MFIATKIHNQSLGRVYLCDNFNDAFNQAKAMAESTLDRELTENELDDLNVEYEVYIDDDHDNQYTFCIGLIED